MRTKDEILKSRGLDVPKVTKMFKGAMDEYAEEYHRCHKLNDEQLSAFEYRMLYGVNNDCVGTMLKKETLVGYAANNYAEEFYTPAVCKEHFDSGEIIEVSNDGTNWHKANFFATSFEMWHTLSTPNVPWESWKYAKKIHPKPEFKNKSVQLISSSDECNITVVIHKDGVDLHAPNMGCYNVPFSKIDEISKATFDARHFDFDNNIK